MKSDEEFIARIYQKAKERKIEEENAAQIPHQAGRGRSFWAWRALSAAACLCLIVSGAVYAGNLRKKARESSVVQQGEQSGDGAVMALSLDEPGIPIGAGDAAQGDNINPRGRIAPGDEDWQAEEVEDPYSSWQAEEAGNPYPDWQAEEFGNSYPDGKAEEDGNPYSDGQSAVDGESSKTAEASKLRSEKSATTEALWAGFLLANLSETGGN